MLPSPSIERTADGGDGLRASSKSAVPWPAAHVKR